MQFPGLILASLLAACEGGEGGPDLPVSGDLIVTPEPVVVPIESGVVSMTLEAEAYTAISDANNDGVGDFIRGTRADASSGDHMQAKSQRENSYLEYQINLPVDDVYEIAVRSVSRTQSVTLTNSGNAPLNLKKSVDRAIML